MLAGAERLARRRRRAASMVLAVVAMLAGSRPAAAAGPRAEVNVHGSPDEVQKLGATLRSLFPADTELQVTGVETVDGAQVMRESSTPSSGDVVARAWIELHDGPRVTLYVADVSGERILVRHLPRGDEDGELTREATARIVATALEALLGGAQIGVERAKIREELAGPGLPPPAPPAPPLVSPVPATAGRLVFTVGAHYGLQYFSHRVPWVHGPGLIFGARDGVHQTRPGALLSGQFWWPRSANDAVASVRFYACALRLLATVERSLGASLVLNAGIGGGIDLTRVETTAATRVVNVQLTAPTTLATPALRATLGAELRQSHGFSIYTTVAVDADPSGTRYVSLDDGVANQVLRPLALRPSLVLGVATP